MLVRWCGNRVDSSEETIARRAGVELFAVVVRVSAMDVGGDAFMAEDMAALSPKVSIQCQATINKKGGQLTSVF